MKKSPRTKVSLREEAVALRQQLAELRAQQAQGQSAEATLRENTGLSPRSRLASSR